VKFHGQFWIRLLLIWVLAVMTMGGGRLFAAEITGLKEAAPAGGSEADRNSRIRGQLLGGAEDPTVLHISITPDADDPSKMNTWVFVQKKGPQEVCLTLNVEDVITRSYRPSEETFEPTIPSVITTTTSGQSGDLIGFNDLKLFIRPHSADDDFEMNECFRVGSENGCLIEDTTSCDQILTEEDQLCVGAGLGTGGCGGFDHAGAIDQLRKMVALNEAAPIITEAGPILTGPVAVGPADVLQAPEISGALGPGAPIAGSPISDIINATQDVGGGGAAGDEVLVPNVLNITQAAAEAKIVAVGLKLGNVTVVPADGEAVGWLRPIRSAYAFTEVDFCQDARTCNQDPSPNTAVNVGSSVDIAIGSLEAAVPEPPTLTLFVPGLLVVIGLAFWVVRRDRRRHA
jgi:hypothetical protein